MTWTVEKETETEAIRVPRWIHRLYNHICVRYTATHTHIHTQSFADDKKLNLIKFSHSFSLFVPAADFSIYIAAVDAVLSALPLPPLLLLLWAAIVVVVIFKCIQHHIMRFNSLPLSISRELARSLGLCRNRLKWIEWHTMSSTHWHLLFVPCNNSSDGCGLGLPELSRSLTIYYYYLVLHASSSAIELPRTNCDWQLIGVALRVQFFWREYVCARCRCKWKICI